MTGRIGTTVTGRLLIAAGWLLIVTMTGCQQGRPVAAGVEDAEPVRVAETALTENQMVYPWSVVPGGLDSPKAMGKAMETDPVVGAHYAGLQPGTFHPERLAEKKQGYVSYRIRDKIYWTRRMVTLAAGEQVLTDGKTLVRGRCGNLFSETPREPVAPLAEEPPEKTMDEPVRAAQLMPTPEMRAEAPVETETFENPKGFGESATNGSVLPIPQPEEALPPVWVAGTGIGGPGGGGDRSGRHGRRRRRERGCSRCDDAGDPERSCAAADHSAGDAIDGGYDTTAVGADGADASAIDAVDRGVSGVYPAGVAVSAGVGATAAADLGATGGCAAAVATTDRGESAHRDPADVSAAGDATHNASGRATTAGTATVRATPIGATAIGATAVRSATDNAPGCLGSRAGRLGAGRAGNRGDHRRIVATKTLNFPLFRRAGLGVHYLKSAMPGMGASRLGFTREESAVLRQLRTPERVQRFLDEEILYDPSVSCRSPRRVLRERRGHCVEGAMLAVTALRLVGYPPLVLDLQAQRDDDHVLAVFRRDGLWGAMGKSNYAGLRYREPVYKTLRELAMSYFEHYFNQRGERTLRGYSRPINLSRFDGTGWMTSEEDPWQIPNYLTTVSHTPLIPKKVVARLTLSDPLLVAAGKFGMRRAG